MRHHKIAADDTARRTPGAVTFTPITRPSLQKLAPSVGARALTGMSWSAEIPKSLYQH